MDRFMFELLKFLKTGTKSASSNRYISHMDWFILSNYVSQNKDLYESIHRLYGLILAVSFQQKIIKTCQNFTFNKCIYIVHASIFKNNRTHNIQEKFSSSYPLSFELLNSLYIYCCIPLRSYVWRHRKLTPSLYNLPLSILFPQTFVISPLSFQLTIFLFYSIFQLCFIFFLFPWFLSTQHQQILLLLQTHLHPQISTQYQLNLWVFPSLHKPIFSNHIFFTHQPFVFLFLKLHPLISISLIPFTKSCH